VVGVDEIWAPAESTEDISSDVMPLQCDSKISGPSRPYVVRGPTASNADNTVCVSTGIPLKVLTSDRKPAQKTNAYKLVRESGVK
jgi:hypothetical protein